MSFSQNSQQVPWASSTLTGAAGATTSDAQIQAWQQQSAQQSGYAQYAAADSAGMTAEQQAVLYQQQGIASTSPGQVAGSWQSVFGPAAVDPSKQNAGTSGQTNQATSPWAAQQANNWAAVKAAQSMALGAHAAGQTQHTAGQTQQTVAQSPWSAAPTQQTWPSAWGATAAQQATAWHTAQPTATVQADYQNQAKVWLGIVTQLIPPNYGIVDGVAFYVHEVVTPGTKIPQVGDVVKVEALPATDGGQYSWRCTRVEVDPSATSSKHAHAALGPAAYPGTQVSMPTGSKQGPTVLAPTTIAANKPFFRAPAGSRINTKPTAAAAPSGAPVTGTVPVAGQQKQDVDGKYNMVAPPTNSYTADVAMAAAANAMDSNQGAIPVVIIEQPKKVGFGKPPTQLSEEERRKSEQAVQQLKNYGDPSGIGARLLSKMGFGTAGGQGLGKNEQGITAPVDPKGTMGQRGLGFDSGPSARDRDRSRAYDRTRSERDRKPDQGRDSRHKKSYSPSRSRSRSRSPSYSRSRSRSRSRGRGRSRSRSPTVRYTCRPPKAVTYEPVRGLASVSKRYNSLYIPSDFVKAECLWLESCPDHSPWPLDRPVLFQIEAKQEEKGSKDKESREGKDKEGRGSKDKESTCGKDKENRDGKEKEGTEGREKESREGKEKESKDSKENENRDSKDTGGKDSKEKESRESKDKVFVERQKRSKDATPMATTSAGPAAGGAALPSPLSGEDVAAGKCWSAKVVLMSGISPMALYAADARLFQHPMKKVQFLVGKRGKGELLLLGGAWDPVDGVPPHKDFWSLTRTAARTFKEATGVDLSQSTQWVKFAHFQYLRSSNRKESFVEHTVVFLVDVCSLTSPTPGALEAISSAENAAHEEEAARQEMEALEAALQEHSTVLANLTEAVEESERADISTLTVVQLQAELSKRGLDTKWTPLKGKKELLDRLKEHMEQQQEAEQKVDVAGSAAKKDALAALEDLKERVSKAKEALKVARNNARNAPKLLENPPCTEQLVIWSSKDSKSLRCSAISLDSLLDYTEDDTKETTFEVSLFSEMFLEMLQTRFGRVICRCLPVIAARVEQARQEERKREREKERDRDRDRDRGRDRERERDKDRDKDRDKERDCEKERDRDGKREKEREKEGEKGSDKLHAPKDKVLEGEQAKVPGGKEQEKESDAVKGDTAMTDVLRDANSTPPTTPHHTKAALADTASMPAPDTPASALNGPPAEQIGTETPAANGSTTTERREVGGAQLEKERAPEEPNGSATPNLGPLSPSNTPTAGGGRKKRGLDERGEGGDVGSTAGSKKVKVHESGAGASGSVGVLSPAENLRVAFRFFDEKCSGYLDLEDLEEILFMTMQDVSRRRVQQMVQVVCKRGELSYEEYADLVVPAPPSALLPVALDSASGEAVLKSSTTGRSLVMLDGVALDLFQVQQKLTEAVRSHRLAEAEARKREEEVAAAKSSEARAQERLAVLREQVHVLEASLAAASKMQQQMEGTVARCVEAFQAVQAALQAGCSILSVPVPAATPSAQTGSAVEVKQEEDKPAAMNSLVGDLCPGDIN